MKMNRQNQKEETKHFDKDRRFSFWKEFCDYNLQPDGALLNLLLMFQPKTSVEFEIKLSYCFARQSLKITTSPLINQVFRKSRQEKTLFELVSFLKICISIEF